LVPLKALTLNLCIMFCYLTSVVASSLARVEATRIQSHLLFPLCIVKKQLLLLEVKYGTKKESELTLAFWAKYIHYTGFD